MRRWLPANLSLGPGRPEVTWLDLAGIKFEEPFFRDTVLRARASKPPAAERKTGLQPLLRALEGGESLIEPSGIIFHISRCGSTLLGNALRLADGCTVLSEPGPVNEVLLADLSSVPSSSHWEHGDIRGGILKALVHVLGDSGGERRQVVLKLTSWNILLISRVRSLWPDVPIVTMTRDPTEVAVSNLLEPSTWLKQIKNSPKEASRIFGWHENNSLLMSTAEFNARVIGCYCRAAQQPGLMARILDYDELDSAAVREVGEMFGLRLPKRDEGRMGEIFRTYAKDPLGKRPFKDDRRRKQEAADSRLRAAIEQWASGDYLRLRAQSNRRA